MVLPFLIIHYSLFTIHYSLRRCKRRYLVALSEPDSNKSRKLLQKKQSAVCPANSTIKNPQKSSLCEDDYGEFFKKALIQNQKRLTDAEAASIVEEYHSGISTYALAVKYGCNRKTVSQCLKKHGVNVTNEKIGSEADVDEMIKLYNEGINAAEIAKRLGVAQTTVTRRLHANGVEMRTRWDYKNRP